MNINDLVYGHRQAKRALQVMLKRSQDRYYRKCVKGETEYQDTIKCLLIGQSGTGKTHLVQSLKRLYDFPLITLDATQLMPTGNKDGINREQLKKLINNTASEYLKDIKYHSLDGVLNQMVIFVDEFDKLGNSFDSSGNWNKHVQSNFLTMIEGEFNGISWVFSGAFAGLYEQSTKQESIGFFKEDKPEQIIEFTDRDILKAGIIPELLGRINLIVQLDTFDKQDFYAILNKILDRAPELDLDEKTKWEIAEKAYLSGQGIRSLKRQIETIKLDREYEEYFNEISTNNPMA